MDSFTNLVEEMKRLYKVSSLEDVAEKMGYSKKMPQIGAKTGSFRRTRS